MEKKKKGKGIVVAIIIIAIAVGGYFAYNAIFSNQIEDVPHVEVKEVGSCQTEYYLYEGDDSLKALKILDKNDAYYYKIENIKGGVSVKQVNKEDFDNGGSIKSDKVARDVRRCLKSFLNKNYEKLPADVYKENPTNQKTIFGDMNFSMDTDEIEPKITRALGTEMKKLFDDYELIISCDDINIDKMAVYDTERTAFIEGIGTSAEQIDYLVIATADVFTEHSKKGVSEVSCFAEEGESKKLKIMLHPTTDDYFKFLSVYSIFIE